MSVSAASTSVSIDVQWSADRRQARVIMPGQDDLMVCLHVYMCCTAWVHQDSLIDSYVFVDIIYVCNLHIMFAFVKRVFIFVCVFIHKYTHTHVRANEA